MIVREFFRTRKDGVKLYRTYSDEDRLIRKVGTEEIYAEAIDVETVLFTYEETEIPIDDESEEVVEENDQSTLHDMEVGV